MYLILMAMRGFRRAGLYQKVIYLIMKVLKKKEEGDQSNRYIHRMHQNDWLCVKLYWVHSLKEKIQPWKMR